MIFSVFFFVSKIGRENKRNAAIFAALLQLHTSSSVVLFSLVPPVVAKTGESDPKAAALAAAEAAADAAAASNDKQQPLAPLALALRDVLALADQIIEPLFAQFTKAAEATVLDMHRANYATASADSGAGDADQQHGAQQDCSAFVRTLHTHVETFRTRTLAPFATCELISRRCVALTQRLLDFFVRHACLVRPITQAGRLQLAADVAQFEAGVAAPLVQPDAVGTEALRRLGGAPYKRLRRLRPTLFESRFFCCCCCCCCC